MALIETHRLISWDNCLLGEAREIHSYPHCSRPAFDNILLLRRAPGSELCVYEWQMVERIRVRGTRCLLFNRGNPLVKAARLC